MILGHFTATYVLSDLLKKRRFRIHLPALLLGAILPDLVDKPVAFFFSYPGRGGAHSVVVLTILFFVLFRFAGQDKSRTIVRTVYVGCLLHLLQDFASPEIVFWPFLDSWDTRPSLSFFEKLDLFYAHRSVPAQWWIEVISLAYILYSFVRKITLLALKKGKTYSKSTPLPVET